MITRLEIEGFRGVRSLITFVPGRITLISGRNGLGKTTFFDAVDWCLFGSGWRLGDEPSSLSNLYAPDLRPQVTLHFGRGAGRDVIVRTTEGVRLNGELLSDRALLERFINDEDVLPSRDIATTLRRLTYLPQADIRGFVAPSTESERAGLLRSLLGVPGAAVVESSIRRIKDRLAERRRVVLSEIQRCNADLEQAELALPPSSHLRDEGATLAAARLFLGPSGQDVSSPSGLLALCQERLASLRERRSAVEALINFKGKIAGTRMDIRARLAHESTALHALDQDRHVADRGRRELAERLDHGRRRWREADGLVRAAEAELENARLAVSRKRTIADTQREARETQATSEALRAQLREAVRVTESADTRAAAAVEEVGALERRRSEVTRRLALAQRREQVRRDAERLDRDISEHVRMERESSSTTSQLATDIESQRSALAAAGSRYEVAVDRLSQRQRLEELLRELAELTGYTTLEDCPLCGAAYGSHDALVGHITEKVETYQSVTGDDVENAKADRDQLAEILRASEIALISAQREVAGMRSQREALMAQREILVRELNAIAPGEESEQLQAALRDTLIAMTAAQEQQVLAEAAAADARRVQDQLGQATRAGEEERQRQDVQIETTMLQLGAYAATALDDLAPIVYALEEKHRDAVAFRQAIEEEGKRLSEEDARLRTVLSDVDRQKSSGERQIAELTQVTETIDADERVLRERARLGEGVTPEEEQGALDDVVAAAVEGERLVAELDRHVKDAARREAEKTIERLRRTLLEAEERLLELDRADDRFQVLASAAEERAKREADSAATAQQAAIQQCLKALSPYRHLDRVSIAPSVGEILVSDRYLARAVRPDLFSSTGQMNVLALSVFLGVALRQRITTLGMLLLDEPIQNLDDQHFLAFTSMVKRIGLTRQVVFSTADSNVAEVFRRQIRSSWAKEEGDYVEYQWEGFEPATGPVMRRRVIPETDSRSSVNRVA